MGTCFRRIDPKELVEAIVAQLRHLLNEGGTDNLTIVKKTKGVDKTRSFMIQYGITNELVCEELMQLDASHYCYTDNDEDPLFGGVVYVWGMYLLPPLVDSAILLYIKLKFSGKVICMSFHKAEHPLSYPYL